MKNAMTLMLSLVMITSLFAQNESDTEKRNRHEIGFTINNIIENNIIYSTAFEEPILENVQSRRKVAYGISYKYHFDKLTLRSRLIGAYKTYTENEDFDDISTNRNIVTTTGFLEGSIGVEKSVGKKRVQLFYGLDLDIRTAMMNQESDYTDTENDIFDRFRLNENNLTTYGISPLLGLRFFITPQFAISTEIKLTTSISRGETKYSVEYSNSPENNYSTKTDIEGVETGFGSLGQIMISAFF